MRKNDPTFYCTLHRAPLCGKIIILNSTMKTVMKVTNLIRSTNNAFTRKKFKNFLQEISATYEDPSLHTEIRWLSSAYPDSFH